MKAFIFGLVSIASLSLSGCSSSSNSSTTTPPTASYAIGGAISGLTGTGLVLQNNGSDNLTIPANQTTFTFSSAIVSGNAYAVTVLTQPSSPTENCAVTGGSGTATGNVTNIQVACSASTVPTYTIGGTVSGLSGTGLVLQDNGGDNLTIPANGNFTFATPIAGGAMYNVSILTQPSNPSQTCIATSGSGTPTENVYNIKVGCTTGTAYSIGGTVSGLSGTGLILQDNGSDYLTVIANGNFTFATPIASGSAYVVSVLLQPSNPAQNCAVTNGSGTATAPVSNIQITCSSNFTVGGTLLGLGGAGLVLQNNNANNLATKSNGVFTFTATVANGAAYSVTVLTQPSNPAQSCTVTGGTGTASSNVINVVVTCLYASSTSNQWTWEGGPDTANQGGTFGTMGIASASNVPSARALSASWMDASGNLWMFGGIGYGSPTTGAPQVVSLLNDLWEYSAGEWTWIGGANLSDQIGSYGTQGVAAPDNFPSARYGATSWLDASGNFWLFGGYGYDSTRATGSLNDLWKYSAGEWTWVGGSSVMGQSGVYGTEGAAASGNVPGARYSAVGWADAAGDLWLFGGEGYDSTGTSGYLNDLWKYGGGEWTWASGANLCCQSGSYAAIGQPSPDSFPGSRSASVIWTDPSGDFWLLGGSAYDGTDPNDTAAFNDLWEFGQFDSGEWAYQGGSERINAVGIYGTEGSSSGGWPGARYSGAGWTDGAGNFWLFGGFGANAAPPAPGYLNDLWEFSLGGWTWIGGTSNLNDPGTYGTLGQPGTPNIPNGRLGATTWIDRSGNLWLFGGSGTGTTYTNDLWKYEP